MASSKAGSRNHDACRFAQAHDKHIDTCWGTQRSSPLVILGAADIPIAHSLMATFQPEDQGFCSPAAVLVFVLAFLIFDTLAGRCALHLQRGLASPILTSASFSNWFWLIASRGCDDSETVCDSFADDCCSKTFGRGAADVRCTCHFANERYYWLNMESSLAWEGHDLAIHDGRAAPQRQSFLFLLLACTLATSATFAAFAMNLCFVESIPRAKGPS